MDILNRHYTKLISSSFYNNFPIFRGYDSIRRYVNTTCVIEIDFLGFFNKLVMLI